MYQFLEKRKEIAEPSRKPPIQHKEYVSPLSIPAVKPQPPLELKVDFSQLPPIQRSLFNPAWEDVRAVHQHLIEPKSAKVTQPPIQRALDNVLGQGAHADITSVMNPNSPYTADNWLEQRALALTNAGMSAQNTHRLMKGIGRVVTSRGKYLRCITWAVQMHNANVPFGLLAPLMVNHMPNVAQGNANHYIHLATQLRAWSYNAVNALINGHGGGLTLSNWADIAAVFANNSHANAITFAQTANWNAVSIRNIAQAFQINANNLTAANWVAIAGDLGNNAHANTRRFAQTAGWNVASIRNIAQGFVADNGGLNAAQWVQVAGNVGANNHADAIAFAQIGWNNAAEVVALTAHYANNAYGENRARWIQIAALSNQRPNYAREMVHYFSNGWPLTIAFNGGNASLFLVNDGVGYGQGNPHVTVHGIDENTHRNAWRGNDAEYHVRLAGGGPNVYDFRGTHDAFFDNVNMTNAPQARILAQQFRNAMGF